MYVREKNDAIAEVQPNFFFEWSSRVKELKPDNSDHHEYLDFSFTNHGNQCRVVSCDFSEKSVAECHVFQNLPVQLLQTGAISGSLILPTFNDRSIILSLKLALTYLDCVGREGTYTLIIFHSGISWSPAGKHHDVPKFSFSGF